MTYGVTPEGFARKPESEIVTSLEQRQRADIAPDLDVSAESVIGQLNGIFARQLGICWEQLEVLARANDPDQAEGDLLEQVCKLTGTERRGAAYSLVTLSCDLDAGATLSPDVAYAAINGDPTRLWTPVSAYTAPITGVLPVRFRAVNPGPIAGPSGTITVIHAPVPGWNSVTNPLDAIPGRVVDQDSVLRLRREQQIARAGSATTKAIIARLFDVAAVEDVKVFENLSAQTDEQGIPGLAIEVVVFDGLVPAGIDADIAQAILESRPAGKRTHGSVAVTVADADGTERVVRFSRAAQRSIYITLTVATGPGYSESALKEHMVSRSRATYGLGSTVRIRELDSFAFDLPGIVDVLDCRIGTSPTPTGTSSIPLSGRQIPTFDTSRITIVAS